MTFRRQQENNCPIFVGRDTPNQVGVDLKEGYNGDLTSRQAGSIGGQMVKKMKPMRNMSYIRNDRTAIGHQVEIKYIANLTV